MDHSRVVDIMRRAQQLPLVKDYLLAVQKNNLGAVRGWFVDKGLLEGSLPFRLEEAAGQAEGRSRARGCKRRLHGHCD